MSVSSHKPFVRSRIRADLRRRRPRSRRLTGAGQANDRSFPSWGPSPGGPRSTWTRRVLPWQWPPNHALNHALGGIDSGSGVAQSTVAVATAQSVVIPSARNGVYHVYVAYTPTSSTNAIHYDGVAEVERTPSALPARDLLPDLQARPQENVTFDTPTFDLFEPAPPAGETCFDSERVEDGARTCLRFDQIMANVGEGAVDLRFSRPAGVFQNEPAQQRIYHSTGGYREISVGEVEFHPVHGHYHFEGFAKSSLWATDSSGDRAGPGPAAEGRKVSFCVADTRLDRWGLKGNYQGLTYVAPDCLMPYASSGGREFFFQGMSPGWADRYDWFLPAQYVEVTGLGDGDYILDTRVDPDNLLLESNDANNCASVRVRLTNMGTPDRHAELLGTGPACAGT